MGKDYEITRFIPTTFQENKKSEKNLGRLQTRGTSQTRKRTIQNISKKGVTSTCGTTLIRYGFIDSEGKHKKKSIAFVTTR